jgi:hypothetical protein
MGRKIIMTGKNAQYFEHRAADAKPDNDREIRMEGDEAVYREYAYGQANHNSQQDDSVNEKDAEDIKLLTSKLERFEPVKESEILEKLKPIFYNNETDVKLFLKEIAGMPSNDITDLVNRWVQEKRISDYGYSRKGTLWSILNNAGLYKKTKQNWNRRVY